VVGEERSVSTRRDLRLFWFAGAVDHLGSHSSSLVLVVLILSLGADPVTAGLLGSLSIGVEAVLGLVGGVLADRVSRRRVMVVSAGVAFLATAALTVAVVVDGITVPVVFAVTAVESAGAAFYGSAARGSLRALLPDGERRQNVLATLSARDQAAAFLGPLLGGVLYQATRWAPFAANAVSYLVAAGCMASVRTELSTPAPPGRSSRRAEPLHRFAADGVRFMWRQPFLRFALTWSAGINAVFTALYYVVMITAQAHGVPASALGTGLAVANGFGVVGALLAPAVLRRVRPAPLVSACSWAMVALVVPLGLVHSVIAYVPLLGGVFLVGPVLSVLFQSMVISVIPPELQGRANSVLAAGGDAVQFVAPALAGLLLVLLSPLAVGAILAAVLAVLAVYATTSFRSVTPGRRGAASAEVPEPASQPRPTVPEGREG
jgi:MFS family permease